MEVEGVVGGDFAHYAHHTFPLLLLLVRQKKQTNKLVWRHYTVTVRPATTAPFKSGTHYPHVT